MTWAREHAATIAFVVVMGLFLGFVAWGQRQVHDNQLESCARGNFLRDVLSGNEEVLRDFLSDAIKTRQMQADAWRASGNLEQARINAAAAVRYRADLARLRTVQQVDCQKVIR